MYKSTRKTIISGLFLLFLGTFLFAQKLEVHTFGNSGDVPVLFLHGGPGYTSVPFEKTTGDALADAGFFVISYDRRGEGRHENLMAEYTFDQTFNDINEIYAALDLKKAILIGHGFGGVLATLFAERFPDRIERLIIVSTPLSMPKTFKDIIAKSKDIYTAKNDQVNLGYISMLEKMDSTSLEYSGYSFMHARSNGFYSAKNPSPTAKKLYQYFLSDSLLKKYASKMGYLAPQKFWENEGYTTLSIDQNLKNLVESTIPIYGIYGKEDGLYSEAQVKELRAILGSEHLVYLDDCSHNVFIDQQKLFIDAVKRWAN